MPVSRYWKIGESVHQRFPRHGWITGAPGVRHLRLPLLRLYQLEQPHHGRFSALGLAGTWLQMRSPYATLRMLAVTLRDLNVELNIVQHTAEDGWWNREPSEARDATLTREREAIEKAEVLLVAAFVLLRRLADQIADATRPLLFSDWQSAPRKMSIAITAARTASLARLRPLCDLSILEQALVGKTQWFEALRQEEGIRDILVHKDHTFNVSALGTRGPAEAHITWRVTADVRRLRSGKVWHLDALPAMHECMTGLCGFMETICRSLPGGTGYSDGDVLFLIGRDSDVTAFWPAVER